MADEAKTTYPSIPIQAWWELRRRFKTSSPVANPSYIATALNMQEVSAKTNIFPHLVLFGLVDQDGKPLERVRRWREDDLYPEVCKEIREEIYPSELLDALPGPSVNSEAAESWFRRKTGVGQKAAKRMARVYEMLWEAAPSKGQITSGKSSVSGKKTKTVAAKKSTEAVPIDNKPVVRPDSNVHSVVPEAPKIVSSANFGSIVPQFTFNIQIVLPENASPQTYNDIFRSIAVNLLGRGEA